MPAAAVLLAGVLALAAGPAVDVEYDEVWRFADTEIVESSGLVVTDDLVVTVNDSGDSGRIFTVDLATGQTVGVTRWSPDPRDVEALAPAGPRHVWVADIGDNRGVRSSLELLRVPFGRGDRTVTPERYQVVHPGAAVDAESLLAHPVSGQLYVVTKEVFGSRVLALPERLDPRWPNELTEVGRVIGLATDAAFFPDGRHLIIRNYGRAVVYAYPEFQAVGSLVLPDQQQGEGIAVAPDGEVYLSSEGLRQPLLRIVLPGALRVRVSGLTGAEPNPPVETTPDVGAPDVGAPVTPTDPAPTEPAPTDPAPTEPPGDGFVDADGNPWRPEIWPWIAGGLVGLVALLILIRSLRPR
ncbi:hypothetical protein [Nocardioides limicola]|uniref:hypothetical protein n=1 Tax=Nocardioides limicola TaxID=2803368 RepID=UPI00193C490C|nr:hypothetical protein [Nocardioides sp. DJM-14]